MSLWNHYRHLKPEMYEWYDNAPERADVPFPRCPADIHEFFQMWINTNWFAWEREGYPVFVKLKCAHLPNILFVHFQDLLDDLEGQMRGIAHYLDIEIDEAVWPVLVDKATFKTMKANAENVVPGEGGFLRGGARRFLHKGTNGRWRGVLTAEELARYVQAVDRQLDAESSAWLEVGAAALKTNAA